MKPVFAILFTLALLAVCHAISRLVNFDLTIPMVAGTSVWAAIDSANLQFRRYRSGMASGPAGVFLLNLMLWIVAFPWYLSARHKIKTGAAVLKDAATPVPA